MKTVKILWGEMDNDIGREAAKKVKTIPGVEISARMERRDANLDREDPLNEPVREIPWIDYESPMERTLTGLLVLTEGIDVIVELTCRDDLLEKMVKLAVRKKIPLICRHPKAEVSKQILQCLYDASRQIPIFWAHVDYGPPDDLLRFAMIMVGKPVMEEEGRFYNSENLWDEYCEKIEAEKS